MASWKVKYVNGDEYQINAVHANWNNQYKYVDFFSSKETNWNTFKGRIPLDNVLFLESVDGTFTKIEKAEPQE